MMVTGFYFTTFILMLISSTVFFWKWHKHVDFYFSLMYCLFPIAALGYFMLSISKDVGNAIFAQKFIYLGGSFLSLLGMHAIFHLAQLRIPRWVTFISLALTFFVFLSALTIGFNGLYYKSQKIVTKYGATVLEKEYGPLHSFFYPMIILYFSLSLAALIYAFKKKNEASRKNLLLLFITLACSVFSFFIARMITDAIEWIPATYFTNSVIYLFIIDRLSLYNIGDTIAETIIRDGNSGFISVDFKGNYLGSTPQAKKLLPALRDERVDLELKDPVIRENVNSWIEDFKKDEVTHDIFMDYNSMIYRVQIKYLYDGKRRRGYQIRIEDDTGHRQYLKTLEDYNKNIKEELAVKTKMIGELRNNAE